MPWLPRDCSAEGKQGLSIHEPSNTRNQSDSTSEGEHVTSQLAATSIATLEQGESSKGRKRSYDSARYASLTPEQRKARTERDRIRRQSLTPEAREEINARRRSRMQSLTLEERQEKNARRRARRQSLPPEQRQALLNRVKENYTARRAVPCAESTAMQCPELGGSPLINPLCSIPTSSVVNGAREMLPIVDVDTIVEPGASALAISSSSIPTSGVENDALGTLLDDVMDEDIIPEPSASSVANPSMPPFTIGTDDDLDNFLKDVMHEDRIPEEEMDEEYYLFAGEGKF
nr:uncharacterized protein LOC127307725 isoform X3 [Lolium perenne]